MPSVFLRVRPDLTTLCLLAVVFCSGLYLLLREVLDEGDDYTYLWVYGQMVVVRDGAGVVNGSCRFSPKVSDLVSP